MPLDINELLTFSKPRDANCANRGHNKRLRQLIEKTDQAYPVLHNYLLGAKQSLQDLCRDHPKKVIENFSKERRNDWILIVNLSGQARRHGFSEAESDQENRERLRKASNTMIEWEAARRKVEREKMRQKFRSLALETKEACQIYADQV